MHIRKIPNFIYLLNINRGFTFLQFSAKVVCVRTAKDQDTMLENALMLPFVTIVDFQGKIKTVSVLNQKS